jgi:hypothetical protein
MVQKAEVQNKLFTNIVFIKLMFKYISEISWFIKLRFRKLRFGKPRFRRLRFISGIVHSIVELFGPYGNCYFRI